METEIDIQLISPPDRKKLTAGLLIGTYQFAEINVEQGAPIVELDTSGTGALAFPLQTLLGALDLATRRLLEATP
jgi:hypothetical protein